MSELRCYKIQPSSGNPAAALARAAHQQLALGSVTKAQPRIESVTAFSTGSVLIQAAMIRLGKLADYALVLMTVLAERRGEAMLSTRELAIESKLPLPTVTKVLKALHGGGLLHSHRGANGGYVLSRDPTAISVAEIITAIEGSIALTECSTEFEGLCGLEPSCPIRSNLQIISRAVRGALEGVTLADLARPLTSESLRYTRETVVMLPVQPKRVS